MTTRYSRHSAKDAVPLAAAALALGLSPAPVSASQCADECDFAYWDCLTQQTVLFCTGYWRDCMCYNCGYQNFCFS